MHEPDGNLSQEEVMFALIERVHARKASPDNLLELIPTRISLNQVNLAQKFAIEMLIEYGKEDKVINRLAGNIELVNTSRHGKDIIISLLKSKKYRNVIEKFSTPFQLDKMDMDEYMFFRQVLSIRPDLAEYFGQAFPMNTRVNDLSDIALRIVLLIAEFSKKDVISPLFTSADIFALSPEEDTLLTTVLRRGVVPEIFKEALFFSKSPRERIAPTDLAGENVQAGQYERYIQEFQKKLKFLHSHGDWTLSQLQKDDLTDSDSKLYVYTNSKTKEMFFRGKDIPSESLEILKDVINNYSDFMPSNYYWEVEDSTKANVKFGTSGFREVFEGVSLDQLELSSFPDAIKRSIILQRYYIILELYRNGIDHGHPHTRNFNVRFLLEDAMGRKTVEFDPALAIKTARRYGMTLTPIVILRDWDKANRVSV